MLLRVFPDHDAMSRKAALLVAALAEAELPIAGVQVVREQ